MSLLAILALTVGASPGASAASAAAPGDRGWAQFRFGAAHTGFNPFERTLSAANVAGLRVKWSVPTSGENFSPPAVFEGTVYQGSRGALAAFDAQSGTPRWSVPVDARFPAVSDGLVIACVIPLSLTAFDRRTGTQVWSRPANCGGTGPTVARRVVFGEPAVVYAFTGSGLANMRIAAFRASTGAPVWTSACPAGKFPTAGAPAVANGRASVLCASQTPGQSPELVTFDAATGALQWRAPLATIAVNSPATVARGRVYVASASLGINGSTPPGKVFALDARTGAPVWTATVPVPLLGFWAPAVAYGLVYVLGTDGVLRALDASTGGSRWTASADVPGNFDSPSVANGVVYTAGFHGVVEAFDASTGAQLFEHTLSQVFGGNAVIAGGSLFVATFSRGLYAFGLP